MISERAMMWNAGGSNDKRHPSRFSYVERQENTERIKAVVKSANVNRATLLDTKAQGDCLTTDKLNGERIAEKYGFQSGSYVRLNSKRLKKIGRGGGEIVFLTQAAKIEAQPIDLGERQALHTVVDEGKYGLNVVSVYLDDENEDERLTETRALLSFLKKLDGPIELNLDANSLRHNMSGVQLKTKLRDLGARALAYGLPSLAPHLPDKGLFHEVHWAAKVVPEMNRRQVMPLFETAGFTDADPQKQPTAPAKFPIFGGDWVLTNEGVVINDLRSMSVNGASDHLALTYTATYE